MMLEALEARIALSTAAMSGVATPAVVKPLGQVATEIGRSHTTASVATPQHNDGVTAVELSSVSVGSDGHVTMTTADGAKVYARVGDGWKLIAWDHQTQQGWVQESWDAGGRYQKDVWADRLRLPLSRLSQTVIVNGTMTIRLFHQKGVDVYGYHALYPFSPDGSYKTSSVNATVTWTYKLDPDVNHRDLVEYRVVNGDPKANAWWAANPPSAPYFNPKYNGWFEVYPGVNGISPPDAPSSELATVHPHVDIVKEPPGVTVETQSRDGDRIETVWSTGRTQSIRFVYRGDALIERTYGDSVGGKWVTTTDHSKAFITQTATYDKPSGKLETSVTSRETADGRPVTFYGTWTSGTNVADATGVETASNYLGFSSVTVKYQDGKPVARYGLLQQSLGGGYATDTFDASGTGVIRREISQTQGGPVVQTWTGSGGDLTISRQDPSADIKHDVSYYKWNVPNAFLSGYTLLKYDATFVNPVELYFDGAKGPQRSTQYHWRQFYSNDEWHYREKATGAEYIASSDPSPQVAYTQPRPDEFWNKV